MTIEQQLQSLGWSDEQVRAKARIIESGHAAAESAARGIEPLHCVAVAIAGGESVREGFVNSDRRMQIGGVYGHRVLAVISKPYRYVGGDTWTIDVGGLRAVLADGTEVRKADDSNTPAFTAAGREFATVVDAAIALTPAE